MRRAILVAGLLVALGIIPARADQLPVEPPGGGRIAFVSNRSGTIDLWIMNADGTGRTELAAGGTQGGISQPVWSPDGARIGFLNVNTDPTDSDPDDDDTTRVWVVNPDRTGLAQLTPYSDYVSHMTWSPDGRIAYDDVADEGIVVINGDGTNPIVHPYRPGFFDDHPVWSPDGRRIAFVSQADDRGEIWLMSPDGSDATQLTSSGGAVNYLTAMAWSPDSGRIAYTTEQTGLTELWVIDADGTDARKLADGADPVWSPDGARIAFTRGNDVWVIGTGPGAVDATNLTGDAKSSDPDWSPDGSRIAFVSTRAGSQNIWVMRADGTDPVRLTDTDRLDSAPRWQPAPHGQPVPPPPDQDGQPSDPGGAEPVGGGDQSPAPPGTPGRSGYWMLTDAGHVFPFGDAHDFGDAPGPGRQVDVEPTPTGEGYWILATGGAVSARGDARGLGDATNKLQAGERAAALSATPTGGGYWIFTDRGRVLPFGDAAFLGDLGGVTLNGPVLDSVATPSGKGYWMVGSDGGIFTFGDATFSGSTGNMKLNQPVISMAADPDGNGYWLVAADGGIFAFDAPFHGSMGATRLNKPISGIVPGTAGYLMVAEDGGIFAFGDVAFHGSLGAAPPAHPVVAVALLRR